MAKRQATNTRQSRTQEAAYPPARRSTRGTRTGMPPFVTADDLADGPNKFVIGERISVYQRDDGTTVLFIDVISAREERFTWAMNCKGPDRGALQTQCGQDILKWPGKQIALVPVQGTRGGWFVNLHRADRQDINDDDIPF